MTKQRKKLVIRTDAHWEAVSNPTRAEMLEVLSASGTTPISIREIADAMGRSAGLIHHHMPVLQEAGLVLECEPRQLENRQEKTFIEAGAKWVYDIKSDPEAFVKGFLKKAKAASRANERSLEKAMASQSTAGLAAMHRNDVLRTETGRLSAEEAAAVREHIDAIMAIFSDARSRTEGEVSTMFWSFFPMGDA